MSRKPESRRNLGQSKAVWVPQYGAVRLFRASSRLRQKMVNVGEIADFVGWMGANFSDAAVVPTREKLWDLMVRRLSQPAIRGVEFGVAFGYSTEWWLTRLPGSGVSWDGFDRFTGLPRAWRDLPAGAFDNQGQPPDLADPRVVWHVGDVENTITDLIVDRTTPQQLVVLFDLDIFEPSLRAWEHLRDSLRPGDLLYFDEAFDDDERLLLDRHILPAGRYQCVGATPTALALQVEAVDPR